MRWLSTLTETAIFMYFSFSLISLYFALAVGHFCMGFLALALFFNYRCLKAASASASEVYLVG